MAECSDPGLLGPSLSSHKEKRKCGWRKLEPSWVPKRVMFRVTWGRGRKSGLMLDQDGGRAL